jgi:ATP phosphoribosyltransferase
MEQIVRIAVQKSGRLSDDSLSLIKECGIKFYNGTGKLKSTSTNFPVEFLFLRDDDIPGYVADGVADLGIVGQNEVALWRSPLASVWPKASVTSSAQAPR